jgi:hypothetical protein
MAEKAKLNCWEYMKCGREEGGSNAPELGVCPASIASHETGELQGIHDGKNGGRCCWIITGTMCKGKIEGTFAKKYDSCTQCNFYKLVKQEEGKWFMLSSVLFSLVNKELNVEIFQD